MSKVNINELEKKCIDMKKELAALKMQVMLGQDKDSAKVRKLRRENTKLRDQLELKKPLMLTEDMEVKE